MSIPLTIWLLLALTVFWSVGMYNRVMRLRARAVTHMAEIDLVIQQCAGLLLLMREQREQQSDVLPELYCDQLEHHHLLSRLDAFLAYKSDPFGARKLMLLDEISLQLNACQRQSNARPVDGWCQPYPEASTFQWGSLSDELQRRVTELRLVLTQYNDAISQVPAKWVAALFGFKVAMVHL